jgi:hypothetical protein
MGELAGRGTHLAISHFLFVVGGRPAGLPGVVASESVGRKSAHLVPLTMNYRCLPSGSPVLTFPGGMASMGRIEASRLVRVVMVVESKMSLDALQTRIEF